MINIAALLVGVGLVLVAAVAGGLLTGWLVQLAVWRITRKKLAEPLRRSVRTLGGIGAGLLVFMLTFRGGGGGAGFGLGLGGGPGGFGLLGKWFGLKESQGTGDAQTTQNASTAPPKPQSTAPDKPPVPNLEHVVVEMVQGTVAKDRYYRIQGKEMDLKEVLEFFDLHTDDLKRIEIVVYPDSVAVEHAAVQNLKTSADLRPRRLQVSITTKPQP